MAIKRVPALLGILVVASLLGGCSKKEEVVTEEDAEATEAAAPVETAPTASAAPEAPAQETMPGENAVRSALAAKDYSTAVARLVEMKRAIPTEMWTHYMEFYGEVRNSLAEAATTDPKAAQALAVLRGMTAGR